MDNDDTGIELHKTKEGLVDGQTQEEPAFLDDDGPSAEIPLFITTKNARELFDLRPGETMSEAIARLNSKGK